MTNTEIMWKYAPEIAEFYFSPAILPADFPLPIPTLPIPTEYIDNLSNQEMLEFIDYTADVVKVFFRSRGASKQVMAEFDMCINMWRGWHEFAAINMGRGYQVFDDKGMLDEIL